MRGSRNGVQALIKREYPHAHFLHCYANQLNVLVKRMYSDISLARIFFANVSGFSSFFATYQNEQTGWKMCANVRFCIVRQHDGISCLVSFEAIKENHQELLTCFSEMKSSPKWEDITIREAQGLKRLLMDPEFCFSLDFLLTYLFELVFCRTSFRFTS